MKPTIPLIIIFLLGVWSTVCLIKDLRPDLSDSSPVMSLIIWVALIGWVQYIFDKKK